MARQKIIPDQEVYTALRHLWVTGGDKAVSFGTVAAATGLAPATLAQRFGSRDSMVQNALATAWDEIEIATQNVEAAAPLNAKGAALLLKSLTEIAMVADISALTMQFRNPTLCAMASTWRAQVENALSIRLGGGPTGKERAALIFAAWQGQLLWQNSGGKGFKLKDALKRFGG